VGGTGKEQIVYYVATVWALLWAGLILFSAGRQWLRERRQNQVGQTEVQPGEAEVRLAQDHEDEEGPAA
jgi:flagellar biosynthesis/type III secretory pathway M-ring protein FliF/YscJ